MEIKSYKHIIYFLVGIVVTLSLYGWFVTSPYFLDFKTWSEGNKFLLGGVLIFVKAVGIIWPPIPGGFLTVGSIPVLGWWESYLADFIGSMIGASVAFFISRKYGEKLLTKIFDESAIKKMHSLKVHRHREVEAVFMFRLFGGSLVEVICYAAGLLKISYKNFLIGSVLSHLVVGLPFFYFAQNLFSGRNILFNIIFVVIVLSLFNFFKNRYFHVEEIG